MWYEAEQDRVLRSCRLFMNYIINEILFCDRTDIEKKLLYVEEYGKFEDKFWQIKEELRG